MDPNNPTPAPSGTPAPGNQPAPENKPPLLAGKYADQAALEKGIREASTKLDFDALPDGDLIGEGKRFKDTAAAEKYYRGLDKMIGGTKTAETPKPNGEVAPLKLGEDPLPDDAPPEKVIERAGLKAADLAKQWAEKKSLTDEQYAKIKAADPRLSRMNNEQARSLINEKMELEQLRFVTRQQAQASAQAACADVAGGRDKLDALLKAAPTFVPADELPAMEKMISDPATAKSAVRLLMQMQADHIGAGGSRPLINGQPAASGATGIKTLADYKSVETRAMRGDKGAQALLLQLDDAFVAKLK